MVTDRLSGSLPKPRRQRRSMSFAILLVDFGQLPGQGERTHRREGDALAGRLRLTGERRFKRHSRYRDEKKAPAP